MIEHYSGPATISDGAHESVLEVEIHAMPGQDATIVAWHVNVRGRLSQELRLPAGKALSVRLANGRQGVGTLVDPQLIRGVGKPPLG